MTLKKLNVFLLLCICTIASCKDSFFPQRELCTSLGVDGGICTDKRLDLEDGDQPPVGCQAVGKHSYDCPDPDRFTTYQMTDIKTYEEFRNLCEDYALKLRQCERRCD